MFRSAAVDRLTRVHPAVPTLLYGPAIAALMVHAWVTTPADEALAAAGSGWLVWTLTEYWVHRTVFHHEPVNGLGARLHWMIHGVHHDHPNDPRRLVMPPALSVPIALAFLGLAVLALGSTGWAVSAGFYAGYLIYDTIHFALHHRRPRSRAGRLLHQLHMRHHFEDERRGYGVSAPWWDIVFGTRAGPRRGAATGPASSSSHRRR